MAMQNYAETPKQPPSYQQNIQYLPHAQSQLQPHTHPEGSAPIYSQGYQQPNNQLKMTIKDIVSKYESKLPSDSISSWKSKMVFTQNFRKGFDIWFYAYLAYFAFAPKKKWFHLTMTPRASFFRLASLGFVPTSILGLMRVQANYGFLKENHEILSQILSPEESKYFDISSN